MHNNKILKIITFLFRVIIFILPLIFWGLMIFALDTPYAASSTIIAVAVHECGHKAAIFMSGIGHSAIRPVLSGFRIKIAAHSSYNTDILCAAAGPLSNLLLVCFSLPLCLLSLDAYITFAVVNFVTALSNLLPVKGFDGYAILIALAGKSSKENFFISIIETFSFLTVCTFTFMALYFIEKIDEGYWFFFLFFFYLLTEITKSSLFKQNRE